MSTKDTFLYLVGAGGHAKVVFDAILAAGEVPYTLAIADGNAKRFGEMFMQALPIEVHHEGMFTGHMFHICVGDNCIRARLYQQALSCGGQSFTVLHPKACVAVSAKVDDGTLVAANAVIGPQALVGCAVIVNHGAVVDHDCVIGDFCHIAPNATLGGGVKVGDNVLIGAGATVLPCVEIAADCIIGAGAVVTENISTKGVYVGAPAKKVHDIMDGPSQV